MCASVLDTLALRVLQGQHVAPGMCYSRCNHRQNNCYAVAITTTSPQEWLEPGRGECSTRFL